MFTEAGNRRSMRHIIHYKYIFVFDMSFECFIIYLVFIVFHYQLFISLQKIKYIPIV